MASPWIDVSVTLRTGMVHWPGDPPVQPTKCGGGENWTTPACLQQPA